MSEARAPETFPVNRRILVVDDNREIHQDFAKILTPTSAGSGELDELKAELFGEKASAGGAGFELDCASSGADALVAVEEAVRKGAPYALAFVDVRMPPGWDGVETVGRLWQVDPRLQVVLCTAYSDYTWDDIRETLAKADGLLVLKKPFDNIEVLQLAQALTAKWSLERVALATREVLTDLVRERTHELEKVVAELEAQAAEQLRLETELRLAQKLEAVGQLAAGIAHEINTPMQYIGDSVHFLQGAFDDLLPLLAKLRECAQSLTGTPDHEQLVAAVVAAEENADIEYVKEQVPRALERTLEGVEHVSSIVRAMREFAHPGQKDQASADLNKALENALTVSRNEYKYVADVETDFGELPSVLCLVSELNQVFLNLIVNAAHAIAAVVQGTERKGVIRIVTRCEGETVRISISDTGTGIPEEIRERVFDPFFTTKPVGKGTGQGLAIARAIVVDKHGGRLGFDTEPGQGTTFHIDLPVRGRTDETGSTP